MEVITHSHFVAGFWKGTLKPFEVITVEKVDFRAWFCVVI
jgi:hypothetical protein